MTFSMTAFASARCETQLGRLSVEIRSLNHRFLELSVRLPDDLRQADPVIRELTQKRLARGKVDISIKFSPNPGAAGLTPTINESLAQQLALMEQQLSSHMNDLLPSSSVEWLRWPGLVQDPELDFNQLLEPLNKLINEALDLLIAFRQREGSRLNQLLAQRLEGISQIAKDVRQHLPEIRSAEHQRMLDKAQSLIENVDPQRLEQELALVLQKIDIDEELDRLDGHVVEVQHTLVQDKPVGRRLDFLMQELHREANTLGSKSIDARTSKASVDLKVLIEQMREQVQNIE